MRWLVVPGLVLCAGCSVLVGGTPERIPGDGDLECSPIGPSVDTTLATLTLGFDAVVLSNPPAGEREGRKQVFWALVTLPVGLVLAGSALYGWFDYGHCRRLRRSPPRDFAIAIADHATEVATSGDCNGAMRIAPRILRYDRDYYETDFLRRPAIMKCLDDATAKLKAAAEEKRRLDDEIAKRRRRDEAQALVGQARKAARAGDCTTASALGGRIRELDEHVYSVWVVTDPQIAACTSPP